MTESSAPPSASERAHRLELVRALNLTLRGDRSMQDLYRTRFEGRPPRVRKQDDSVTVEYPRGLLGLDRRRSASWITLNAGVPWRIEALGTLTKLTADLGGVALQAFEVSKGGASRVVLTLPRPSGEVPIRIAGGLYDVRIQRPAGVPARVQVAGGASQLTLDDQRFRAVGGGVNWRHPDYDGAEDRYEVVVRGGAKALTVGTLETAPGPGGPPRRVLATVLFTDIVGSTDRAREVGDSRWRELLDRHDAAARRLVEAHGGRLVKTTGDGILATFDRPGHGIGFARAFRGEFRELGIDIRAGLHTGEVEYRGDDVGGIAVHIASRIMDAAGPREILVSRTVRDLVAGSDVTLEDRGTHSLKGVDEWQLFAVTSSD